MKSSLIIIAASLAASMAMAQAKATPNQPASQSGQAQGQAGANSSSPGTTQTPPTGGTRVLQAKSQDELKAYQDASAKTNPAEMAAAADAFAEKYPTSEMRGTLYIRAMSLYAHANNAWMKPPRTPRPRSTISIPA